MATRPRSTAWPSRPTAVCSPRAATTAPSTSGDPGPDPHPRDHAPSPLSRDRVEAGPGPLPHVLDAPEPRVPVLEEASGPLLLPGQQEIERVAVRQRGGVRGLGRGLQERPQDRVEFVVELVIPEG